MANGSVRSVLFFNFWVKFILNVGQASKNLIRTPWRHFIYFSLDIFCKIVSVLDSGFEDYRKISCNVVHLIERTSASDINFLAPEMSILIVLAEREREGERESQSKYLSY